MAKKCFLVWGVNCSGGKFSSFICADTIQTPAGGCGTNIVIDGTNYGSNQVNNFVIVPNDDHSRIPAGYPFSGGNCSSCNTLIIKYDCVNGNCVQSTTYNTPGFFDNLSDCQNNCSTNTNSCNSPFECIDPSNFCPPNKVCVPQDEWGQITNLIHQNISKHCH